MITIKAALIATLAVFLPIKAVLITVIALIIVDMVSGMAVARSKGEKITSKAMGRTIVKILVYEFSIMAGFLAERYLLDGSIPLVKLLAGLVGVTEMVSVLENADILSGNTMFASIVSMLQSKSNKNSDPQ